MKYAILALLFSGSAFAQAPLDIHVSLGNISVSVRGSGDYVCSAEDSFKNRPRLGRGMTQAEAAANAKFLATQTAGGNDFFVKVTGCEASKSGAGNISITADAGQIHVSVEGPTAAQCIATDSMHDGMAPIIVNAATMTEAKALASDACTSSSNDDGFFCKLNCQQIAQPAAAPGGITIPKIKIGGLFGRH